MVSIYGRITLFNGGTDKEFGVGAEIVFLSLDDRQKSDKG